MPLYQILLLGDFNVKQRDVLLNAISIRVADFGLLINHDLAILEGDDALTASKRYPSVAVYFGCPTPHKHQIIAQQLVNRGFSIIPVITDGADFSLHLPSFLAPFNGIKLGKSSADINELATSMLECIGLLRDQRRAFISYFRKESSGAALQLHERLSALGYNVFLDTADIRLGKDFQDSLWHHLCDSDLMIMLESPKYFTSRWTSEEFGRAKAKGIHILRLVWPRHKPSREAELAQTIYLKSKDMGKRDGKISENALQNILSATERLRCRSIAARIVDITDKLRASAKRIGATVTGVSSRHAILVRLPCGANVWTYPIVGIPTASTMHNVADRAIQTEYDDRPVLIYDHIGISKSWQSHLEWLDKNIHSVRSIKVDEAAFELIGLASGK